jgi:hypothetical protein
MRQLELEQVLDDASIRELTLGNRVQLVFQKVTVAEIVPVDAAAIESKRAEKAKEREEARQTLLEIMNHGYDMGGFKITNRDELYDRD